MHSRLRHWLDLQPPDHFLLIEPDEELRRILMAEMQGAVTLPVKGCGLEHAQLSEKLEGAIPVVLARQGEDRAASTVGGSRVAHVAGSFSAGVPDKLAARSSGRSCWHCIAIARAF